MGRSASPVTPGTNPTTDTPADLEEAVVQEGVKAEVAASENDDLRAIVAKQSEMIADMQRSMQALARNQVASVMPEKVELPTMASVVKSAPKVPVLTAEGWYVPPVHPTDREKA